MTYKIDNIDTCDSPSLVVYQNLVEQNIDKMLTMVQGEAERLMPHVKTNKTTEVVAIMVDKGIQKFKASTISEAEMCILAGAKEVLIAHQLVGPKVSRFMELVKKHPAVKLSFLIDDTTYAQEVNQIAVDSHIQINVFIDINNGMHRSGVALNSLEGLIKTIKDLASLSLQGLHIYDGHHRDIDFEVRKEKIQRDFVKVQSFGLPIVIGGTPSFSTHALNPAITCSPGTAVFWDWGYNAILPEQNFKFAALVVCRVISKPSKNVLTLDLGHKAVASENTIDKRITFLNIGEHQLLSQSEEHGLLSVADGNNFKIGDVLYGVPFHICPTVNLYEEMAVVEDGIINKSWNVIARKRKISC